MVRTIDECFFLIRNGANIKQGTAEGGFPITRIETITNDKFNRDRMGYAGIRDISQYEAYVLEDGDLLMSHINSAQFLGRTVLYVREANEIIIHGMNLLRLKAKRNIINPAYARYCFYGHEFRAQISNITKKSVNQASFAVKDLKRIKIDVPLISEQTKIVEILDKVQQTISLRRNELSKLDELISARFVELFGEPLSNKNEWQTMSIVEAAPIKSQHGDLADEVWLLNLDAVEAQTGTVLFKNRVQSGEINASTVYFTTDNVLYSKLRPYLNKVVMPDEDGVATSEMIPLYPLADKLNRAYLCYWLRSDAFVRHISEKVSGAKMPRVSMDYFRSLAIELPPLGLQEQFADFVKVVDKSKVIIYRYLKFGCVMVLYR